MDAAAATDATPAARRLVVAMVLAVVVVAIFAVASVILRSPSTSEVRMPMSSVPEGVSLHRLGDHAVALVRHDDDIIAFVPAIPIGDRLVWCESAGVFATALKASRYSTDGVRLYGPGPDDLARYAVRVDGNDLLISRGRRFAVPPLEWTDSLVPRFTSPGDVCPAGGT